MSLWAGVLPGGAALLQLIMAYMHHLPGLWLRPVWCGAFLLCLAAQLFTVHGVSPSPSSDGAIDGTVSGITATGRAALIALYIMLGISSIVVAFLLVRVCTMRWRPVSKNAEDNGMQAGEHFGKGEPGTHVSGFEARQLSHHTKRSRNLSV